MRFVVVLMLVWSLAFAMDTGRRITGIFGEPVEVTGSVVDLVRSFPSYPVWSFVEEGPEVLHSPPSEYGVVDSLECRFVVPDKEGIYPVVVSLSSETIEENSDIQLTAQAQQAVDLAPIWLQEQLIWKMSLLTEANQDRYGALLLAHQGENIYDELAYTVANLSWTILANPSWDETVLVDNAQGIYDVDPLLNYVDVIDYGGADYYSTTEYYTITGTDTVWVEIPKEIYYDFVVMPKVSDERPLNDSSVYNEFWRQYLWDMDDAGYPVFNSVLNPAVLVFWDETPKNYGWETNPVFTDSLHAVDIISKWTYAIIPDPASGNRPIQPNIIAHEHNGNCGEYQDLLSAAARTALLPACCTLDINEDHVWVELWWNGEWHPWQPDWIDNPCIAYDVAYGGSKDCSCIWSWRNDGYTWDDAEIYTETCTFTVNVTDSAGIPVDNATVQIASEGWQTSTVIRGTWGQTDRNGQITFVLGDNQNYYLNISSSLGNFGSGGFESVIVNSVAGQDYYFDWSPEDSMPELDLNELSEGTMTRYLIQVDFDMPEDLMNGRDYYANPRSEYIEPLSGGGTADFFIVDSANWALYQAGEEFDCYELIQGQSSGEVWFYAPHTDDWYIVFSGDRHQGVETFADAQITLWKHDGTGISGETFPSEEPEIYPNPSVDYASITFTTLAEGNADVTLYDVHGRVIRKLCDSYMEAGSHELDVETSSLSNGLYFVRFAGEGLNAVRTMTVLR